MLEVITDRINELQVWWIKRNLKKHDPTRSRVLRSPGQSSAAIPDTNPSQSLSLHRNLLATNPPESN